LLTSKFGFLFINKEYEKVAVYKKNSFDSSKHVIYNFTLHSVYSELDYSEYLLITGHK
jgi:hypothetical protein